ncbi:hypothetical protein COV18_01840 [Candidatus Woesearchaeota archaeon CG10_big_fil_rev_8_21_14_0_10_37_12]|nr:MAG: hypothetical protein COV18_01840 [Candidatus Woesearchaeota archaeon CG10_big_fil_rev_8_21_14_0_10_37_12]
MARQSLVSYVQRLVSQGYDLKVIRTTLEKAGYSNVEIQDAFRAAGATHQHAISTRVLVILFVVLGLLVGVIFVVLTFSREPVELSATLNVLTQEVSPGKVVSVSVDVFNPSGREITSTVDVALSLSGSMVLSEAKQVSVTDRASVSFSLLVPASANFGNYDISAVVLYGSKQITKRSKVSVVAAAQKPEIVIDTVAVPREQLEMCPAGCDDLNFCTTDVCSNGQCSHSPIVPCCGNGACESGESAAICMLDCGGGVSAAGRIDQAANLATVDFSRARNTCDSIGQRNLVDRCLITIATKSKRMEVCDEIVTDDTRDSCYLDFAYDNNYVGCGKIMNQFLKNSCFALQQYSEDISSAEAAGIEINR